MQQITFAAGQTTASITVQTNEDTKFEGTESFSVLLAGGVNYTVNMASSGSTAVILDNDPAPLVSVVATDGVGTETIDGTDFTYTFSRTGNTSSALTVNYTINPGAGRRRNPRRRLPGADRDHHLRGRQQHRGAAVQRHRRRDHREHRTVLGRGRRRRRLSGRHSEPTAGGSIIDNDFTPAVVSLTPATVTTTEGGALTFTFTRAGGNLAGPLTINYVVNDGGPLGGATRADGDFSYASGMQQITFAAGQTSANITVQTNEDTKFEGTESFSVLLAGGVDYTADPVNSGSTGVILDNDPAPLVSVVATDGVGTETIDGTDFTSPSAAPATRRAR